MTDYRNSKWAAQIIELQKDDGSWGYFHSLSNPSKNSIITTEQAIRRLEILGYTINDKPVIKAVSYMQDCLKGKKEIPDRREKGHDWDIFTALILSAWIRRFTKDDHNANNVAERWAEIISRAFEKGSYDHDIYVDTYRKVLEPKPKGGRLLDFANFYHISLLPDFLDDKTASAMIDYILHNKTGIYYIYDKQLSILPQTFKSIEASRYLAAIELLAEYKNAECRDRLMFVVEWLNANKEDDGNWDMGPLAKDGVRFPLSDSWRKKELRVKDCTYRTSKLINKFKI